MSAAVGGSRNPDAFLISMRKLCYLFEHVQLCMRNMLTVFKGAGAGCGQGEEEGGRSQGWRGGRVYYVGEEENGAILLKGCCAPPFRT